MCGEFIEWSATVQTDPPHPRRAWLAVSGVYGLLTLLYAWPLLPAFASQLPSDVGDPGLNTWILWWNAQAAPLTGRWWDAPIFFPARGAFALSETLLGIAPLTTPLQWLGASPVAAYNVAFLFSYWSAALAAHALARRLTGSHAAAFVAGVAYGFNPYRAAQLPHLQALLSCWMPLALLGGHAYLATRRVRFLLLIGIAWLLNGLTTGYFLVYFGVLLALWMLWFVRTRRDAAAIGAALAIFSLPFAPLLAGYARHQQALGAARGLGEIVFFSADLSAIWAASPFAWAASHWTLAPRPEGELYPGAVVLGLGLAGAAAAWWRRQRSGGGRAATSESAARRWTRRVLFALGMLVAAAGLASIAGGGWRFSLAGVAVSTSRPFKTFTTATWLVVLSAALHPRTARIWRARTAWLFYGMAAVAMFVLALGPAPHAFGVPIFYQGPYAGLMALPGGHALRVPARFAMPMVLCLSQAAALALMHLTGGRLRAAVAAPIVLAVALDGWIPVLKTDPVPAAIDLSGTDRSIPVLELPIGDTYTDAPAMLRATQHGHPLVNGFSGYAPPHYAALVQGLNERNPEALSPFLDRGPLLVVVRPDHEGFREFVASLPGARLIRETDEGVVYVVSAFRRTGGQSD